MRITVLATSICLTIVGLANAADALAMIRQHTDIPAQSLDNALRTLAKDRGFHIVYLATTVRSLSTQGATGDFTRDEALTQLLQGTGLAYRYLDDETVTISPATTSNDPSPADVIAALDEAHVEKGVVLSMGYFFGSPYLATRHYDVARMTRAENEYVAQQVARNPKRLIGFFSVDPLSDSALAEVRYWADNHRLTGLKLHFANSGVHLKDPEQVRKIAAVVGLAGERKLPMVIHLRAAREFTAEEAEIFIRDILPRAGDSWVQIAHAAGWYGTDQVMFDDLAAFAAHIRRNDPVTRHTLFDLAVVVTPATTPDEATALAKLMRQIGLKRFVVGSDYDLSTPKTSDDLTRAKLPLSNREWRVVARNCAPWAC